MAHEMNSAFCLPDWFPLSRKRRKRKAIQIYIQFFDQMIEERRNSKEQKKDFLGFLLQTALPAGASPRFVRDQFLTILLAGYHATSMSLVWLFHALEQNPEVEDRILDEIREQRAKNPILEFQQLSYVRWTVEETLRMYSPAWSLFARRSTRDVEMRGYNIEAGGWFYIAPFITHRSEQFFPDPLRFEPLRFSPERRKDIPKNAYLPFGLGGHSCIGGRMAIEQLVVCAALIVEQFKIRRVVAQPNPKLSARLVLRPARDFDCTFEPREKIGSWHNQISTEKSDNKQTSLNRASKILDTI